MSELLNLFWHTAVCRNNWRSARGVANLKWSGLMILNEGELLVSLIRDVEYLLAHFTILITSLSFFLEFQINSNLQQAWFFSMRLVFTRFSRINQAKSVNYPEWDECWMNGFDSHLLPAKKFLIHKMIKIDEILQWSSISLILTKHKNALHTNVEVCKLRYGFRKSAFENVYIQKLTKITFRYTKQEKIYNF